MANIMKTFNFQKTFLTLFVGLSVSAMTVVAQNSPPALPYGVPQVLQLAQAKVPDDTIVAYIHNSGNRYNLNADQIIYLRQQGISDNVITVMLSQPGPTTPADNSYAAQVPTPQTPAPAVVTQPAPTYVQTVPSPNVYVVPSAQPYYYNAYTQPIYYPSYSYFPAVSFSFGFGGYHNGYYGGGYHGGYYGGYHGGGYHGGGYYGGGYHGGGWHH